MFGCVIDVGGGFWLYWMLGGMLFVVENNVYNVIYYIYQIVIFGCENLFDVFFFQGWNIGLWNDFFQYDRDSIFCFFFIKFS